MEKDKNILNEDDLAKVSGGTGESEQQEGWWANYKIAERPGHCPWCGRKDPDGDEAIGPIREYDGKMAQIFVCLRCGKEYIVLY